MRVEVGPVPSESAIAWISYARAVLSGFGLRGVKVEAEAGPEVVAAFRGYLDEWEQTAAEDAVFKWTTDLDAEHVQYLVHAFHRVVQRLAEATELRGTALMPPEAVQFDTSLVVGLLDSLAAAGEPMKAFAEELRAFWPGAE
jgi:hypothetical protein